MKKLTALFLALVMALTLTTAFAAEGPSPVTEGEQRLTDENGVVIILTPADNYDGLKPLDPAAEAPARLLPAAVQALISEQVNCDLDDLKIDEMLDIQVLNYKEEYGDVSVNAQFTANYTADDNVAILLNIGGEWSAFANGVNEDGTVKLTLTPAQALAIQNGAPSMVAVLSDK